MAPAAPISTGSGTIRRRWRNVGRLLLRARGKSSADSFFADVRPLECDMRKRCDEGLAYVLFCRTFSGQRTAWSYRSRICCEGGPQRTKSDNVVLFGFKNPQFVWKTTPILMQVDSGDPLHYTCLEVHDNTCYFGGEDSNKIADEFGVAQSEVRIRVEDVYHQPYDFTYDIKNKAAAHDASCTAVKKYISTIGSIRFHQSSKA